MQVIVADDDLSQRMYLAALLKRLGHESVTVVNGGDALEVLGRTDISLVISDVDMPDFDGLRLARAVRSRDFGRYVYLLLVTGQDSAADYVSGLEAGADDFMPKPIRFPLLAVRLKAAERLLRYEEELRIKTRHLAAATRQVEDDLAAAGAAQRASLPEAGLQLPGCRIQPLFLPSQHVSGDMFNYFAIADDLVGFYAADVSGHGVRAALVAAMLGHLVNAEFFGEAVLGHRVEDACRTVRPERLAERLNRRFLQQRDSDIYFTLLCGVIDVAAERAVLCQAGHPHPLLIHHGADDCWLGDGGTPLGLFADAQFSSFTVPFSRGDRLIVTSDGTLEAMSPAGEPFGEARFLDLMRANRDTEAGVLCNNLVRTLSEWTGGARFHDDISMIILDQWEGSP